MLVVDGLEESYSGGQKRTGTCTLADFAYMEWCRCYWWRAWAVGWMASGYLSGPAPSWLFLLQD